MPENAAEKLALAATPTPSTFQRWWRETSPAAAGEQTAVVIVCSRNAFDSVSMAEQHPA
jgi:hypothetical protein